MRPRSLRLFSLYFSSTLAAFAWAGPAAAQPKPPAPNPQAPVLKMPAPLGVQRGTTLDLTLTGTNLNEPTGLWTNFPCKVTIPPDDNNGKDPAKLLVRLEIPKDAPMGFYSIRLATTRGMSNLRLFCIDDLPQVNQVEANRKKEAAQPVTPPCVVVGRTAAESNDYYKVTVQANQKLSFEVLGHRLGGPIDPQITLYDAKTGKELKGGHSNDAPGLQTDPRLTYNFKDAGDYLVEVRDVSYRGGEDFHYRLRIGDFPCATTPLPLAIKRGSKASIQFAGPNVDGVAPVEVTAPADPAEQAVWVAPKGANGLYGWPVSLALSDLDEALEQEPNNEQAKATRVAVPGAVTGRFEAKGDVDWYAFAAKKGTRYVAEIQTQELNSPTDVYATLRDPKGGQIQATDPMKPARLDFTAPEDGDYFVVVEHLHYWFGPEESYRLTVAPYEPGFDLSVALERFDAAQGGSFAFPVNVTRRDYAGVIQLSVVGAGLSGAAEVPMGQPPMPGQPGATLTVNVAADAPMGPLPFLVQGKANINGKDVVQYAMVRGPVTQGLAALAVPPRQTWNAFALAVTEKAPFTLTAKFDAENTQVGKPATLTVTAVRAPGFTGEIVLAVNGVPANVAPALMNIPGDKSEAKLTLNAAANAAPGTYPVTVNGKAKHNNKDFAANAPPANLVLVK
jgi:hypothetical protein